jgi:hypothetical protein
MLFHYVTSYFMENRYLFFVGHVKFEFIACDGNLQATTAATGESLYKCNASLGSSSSVKAPAKSPESLRHYKLRVALHLTKGASSLMSVSTQLEAVRSNGQCTMQLVVSLVDMVSEITEEAAHLNNSMLLKQEINNLHGLIEASPRPTSQHIPREQCILPAEMSHNHAASVQLVPSEALSTQALPAVPIPARTTLTELLYSCVAAVEISPSGPTALHDPDGFKTVTYRKKTAIIYLSETWLNDLCHVHNLFPGRYTVYRSDRSYIDKARGVAF